MKGWCVQSKKKQFVNLTYNVPATRVVICETFLENSLDKPKSAIFGVKLWSRTMLLALISLCTTWGFTSSWRYESPFAIPFEISLLSSHVNLLLFCSSPACQTIIWKPAMLLWVVCSYIIKTHMVGELCALSSLYAWS